MEPAEEGNAGHYCSPVTNRTEGESQRLIPGRHANPPGHCSRGSAFNTQTETHRTTCISAGLSLSSGYAVTIPEDLTLQNPNVKQVESKERAHIIHRRLAQTFVFESPFLVGARKEVKGANGPYQEEKNFDLGTRSPRRSDPPESFSSPPSAGHPEVIWIRVEVCDRQLVLA
ncbi:hypothetical protein R1flu_010258 [Riccia fluitans]|uniref:Uncharacterized protein n=1 Tax=Riccia fluitans TaxID=41844 RepID=A0ABD1Z4H2_9MARC